MFFVNWNYVVPGDTVVTPECTTLETVQTLYATFVAISTFHTSSKLLMRKLVGKSFRFPLPGTLLSPLHSGQAMTSWRLLVRRIPSKQWRQTLCKHGSCFGSVSVVMHTEQDTSSWRLSSKVFISMFKGRNTKWVWRWKQQSPTMEPCDIKIPSLSDR